MPHVIARCVGYDCNLAMGKSRIEFTWVRMYRRMLGNGPAAHHKHDQRKLDEPREPLLPRWPLHRNAPFNRDQLASCTLTIFCPNVWIRGQTVLLPSAVSLDLS